MTALTIIRIWLTLFVLIWVLQWCLGTTERPEEDTPVTTPLSFELEESP